MNLVSEQMAYEHLAELRREAARYSRAASRADRARPGSVRRTANRLALFATHRRPTPIGCQA